MSQHPFAATIFWGGGICAAASTAFGGMMVFAAVVDNASLLQFNSAVVWTGFSGAITVLCAIGHVMTGIADRLAAAARPTPPAAPPHGLIKTHKGYPILRQDGDVIALGGRHATVIAAERAIERHVAATGETT